MKHTQKKTDYHTKRCRNKHKLGLNTRRRKKIMRGGMGYSYSPPAFLAGILNQNVLSTNLTSLLARIQANMTYDHFAYR